MFSRRGCWTCYSGKEAVSALLPAMTQQVKLTMSMTNDITAILTGQLGSLPPLPSNTVKIFLCANYGGKHVHASIRNKFGPSAGLNTCNTQKCRNFWPRNVVKLKNVVIFSTSSVRIVKNKLDINVITVLVYDI